MIFYTTETNCESWLERDLNSRLWHSSPPFYLLSYRDNRDWRRDLSIFSARNIFVEIRLKMTEMCNAIRLFRFLTVALRFRNNRNIKGKWQYNFLFSHLKLYILIFWNYILTSLPIFHILLSSWNIFTWSNEMSAILDKFLIAWTVVLVTSQQGLTI
jgi:hypothetical protein